jgi:hypothetical protein
MTLRSGTTLCSGLALALVVIAGCEGSSVAPRPVAHVGGIVLDASVVEHVAARDGLTAEDARVRAVDTLRLVAAGREQHATSRADPGPVLAPRRAEHLRRAALARLWLTEQFEPAHGPEDIPDDDPRLVRARADPRLVHPEIHVVCQVVVEPPSHVTELSAKAAITSDPAWREAARAAFAPVLARIERNVPVSDAEACRLLEREVELSGNADDPRLAVSFSRPGGFDLEACIEQDESGTCTKPRFDPAWTEQVRSVAVPGRTAPFFTQFGLHLVQVEQRLPAQPAGDPATEQALREAVHDAWRVEALDRKLDELGRARTVRLAAPGEDQP